MTDAGEKLEQRVLRMTKTRSAFYWNDERKAEVAELLRDELERAAGVAEAERGQPEYEHDDVAVMYGKRIAAAIRKLKE